ncbi:MAG: hypothetical protein ACHREM_14495, partial [Polyangiales bacterium]
MTTRSRRTFRASVPFAACVAALSACSAGNLGLPPHGRDAGNGDVGSPGNTGGSDASPIGEGDAALPSWDAGGGLFDASPMPHDSGTPPHDSGAPTPPVDAGSTVPSTYPSGPYGLDKGSVFPLLSLKGYKDATGSWTSISTASYYDPDGSRGITGVFFIVGAEWCGACQSEADAAPAWLTQAYKTRGGVFASAIIEQATDDGSGGYAAATQGTVDTWISTHSTNYDIMLDPHGDSTLPSSGSVGLPHNYVIDPRTMIIVDIEEGFDDGATACSSDNDCSTGYSCSTKVHFCYQSGTAGIIDALDLTMIKNGALSMTK